MFYDRNLMNSRHLGKVWRAANNIEEISDEDTSMSVICSNLDSWIASYHEDTYKRLSLRTSAVLVDGTAKLYKRKINQLYEDVTEFDYKLTCRRRISRHSTDSFNDISSTFTESTQKVSDTAPDKQTDNDSLNTRDTNDECNSNTNSSSTKHQEPLNCSRVDKSIQVSPPRPDSTFDEELPFGHIMIYDHYGDRIPSRIMFSSLNYNINKLA